MQFSFFADKILKIKAITQNMVFNGASYEGIDRTRFFFATGRPISMVKILAKNWVAFLLSFIVNASSLLSYVDQKAAKESLRSSSQAATHPPVYHTRGGSALISCNADVKHESCK